MSAQKHWVTEPNGYLEPVIDKSGAGATAAKTVIQVFHETMSKHGGEPAMGLKRKPEVWCQYWNGARGYVCIHLLLQLSTTPTLNFNHLTTHFYIFNISIPIGWKDS